MYFNDWLSRRCLYTPDKVAIVDDDCGQRFTYRELNARAMGLAQVLTGHFGIRPGERVGCLSTNRLEYLDLYFACGKAGATLVPLNFRYPAAQVVEVLHDCQARVLVYEAAYAEIAHEARTAGAVARLLPFDAENSTPDKPTLAELLAGDAGTTSNTVVHEAAAEDIAMILYTSGTTGRSKGAMISYRQIHWNAINTIIGLQLTQEDVCFLNTPLHHTGGWHVLFTPLMQLGGRLILQKRFDPARCNELLGPEGVTILFGVPTMLRMMGEAPNFAAADFSSVRCAIFGGESCPLPVIEAYLARGVAMRQGYGLTEAGPNCFSLPAADALRKQGSIGLPNFHVAARLVAVDGSEAAVGAVGELWMKGPHVFSGYWRDEAATAETLHDGWIATGDLLTRDAEGYYFVVGRQKEMYVSGGENVYPVQVERILQQHAAVALAAVVGVPDSKWGETGRAYVQLHVPDAASEQDLAAWCRQHLAAFQCPSQIEIVESLPIGPSGKIDKLQLARQSKEDTAP